MAYEPYVWVMTGDTSKYIYAVRAYNYFACVKMHLHRKKM